MHQNEAFARLGNRPRDPRLPPRFLRLFEAFMRRSIQLLTLLILVSGLVVPDPAAAQESQAESTDLVQDPLQQDDDSSQTADEDLVLTSRTRDMILNGEVRDALAMIESSVVAEPDRYSTNDVQRSYAMVVAGFNRIRSLRDVHSTLNQLYDYQLARLQKQDEDVRISGTLRSLLSLAERLDKQDEVAGKLEQALQSGAFMESASDNLQLAFELANLRAIKAAMLLKDEKRGEALELQQREEQRLKAIYEARPEDALGLSMYARCLSNLMQLADQADQRDAWYEEHQEVLRQAINRQPENISFAAQYLAAILFQAGALLESDAQQSLSLIDEGDKVFSDLVVANADAERALQSAKLQLTVFRKRAEGQLVIDGLIGNPAPRLDAEFWVNGEALNLADLQGKVVILDFWAVWCRPCIETFPQINHLNETYAAQGLQIIGVTSRYNITWDEATGQPTRGEAAVEAGEEVEAIRKFMEKYELTYPTLVMPEDSTMGQEFGVTGIPHVVLIDRKGIIRLVKIGGNEQNAAEIEAGIKELLAE
jgi:thiol-disulfide isomerase/thioredoxin